MMLGLSMRDWVLLVVIQICGMLAFSAVMQTSWPWSWREFVAFWIAGFTWGLGTRSYQGDKP